MFDNMKAMGAIAGLMKNKEKLREKGEEFREKVKRIRVTGVAGGSAVRVTVTGELEVVDVFVDPAVMAGVNAEEFAGGGGAGSGDGGGREMAQELIKEATNDALGRARVLIAEEARRMSEELGLPDMPGLEKMLTGGG